jgi:hypothetical protein
MYSPLTLEDLTHDLVWPQLLRAGQLALRPSRLGMAMVFVIGLLLLGSLANRKDGDFKPNVIQNTVTKVVLDVNMMRQGAAPVGEESGTGARLGRMIFAIFASTPAFLARTEPWVFFLVLPLMGAWTAICGGAISRSVACEFAQGVGLEWPRAAGFSLSRWMAMVGALLGPPVIAWVIMLAMAAAGAVLFRAPVVGLLGALLWPLMLVGGLVAAVMLGAYLVGWPMLVPSVACEGTDAVDAIQHAYSFVFARPLRLAVYLGILIVQMLVLGAVVGAVFWLAVEVAQRCGMEWSGVRGADALGWLPGHRHGAATEKSDWPAIRFVVTLWTFVPLLVPVAFIVSFVWSGSTILYLAMRKVVDGQDMHEIWMPGMVAGTMAEASTQEPVKPNTAGNGVSDTGPADET